jgi:hypothetical protein
MKRTREDDAEGTLLPTKRVKQCDGNDDLPQDHPTAKSTTPTIKATSVPRITDAEYFACYEDIVS